MDYTILLKSILAGVFVSILVYVSNKHSAFLGGFLNALPLLVTMSFLGVYLTQADTLEYARGIVFSNIPYVIFTIILFMLLSYTRKPLMSLGLSLTLFIPVFWIVMMFGK